MAEIFNPEIKRKADEIVARYDAKTKQIKGLTILNFALRSKKNTRTVKLPFEINFRPAN